MKISKKTINLFLTRYNYIISANIIAAAIIVFAFFALSSYPFRADDNYIFMGLEWLFAAKSHFFNNYFYPFYTVSAAVIEYCLNSAAVKGFFCVVPLVLSFVLAWRYRSLRAGIFALAISAFAAFHSIADTAYHIDIEEFLISDSLLVFLCAFSLDLRGKIFKGCLLGLFLLVCMQSKGVLFPLVFILTAYSVFTDGFGREALLKNLKTASFMLIIVIAGVLLWGSSNYSSGHGFLSFTENSRRSRENICTGALGFVKTIEGDYDASVLCPKAGDNIFLWAAGETFRHPFRFVSSVLLRLDYIFLGRSNSVFNFVLLFLFCVFFIRFRKDAKKVPLCIAFFYYTGIHLLMPVEPRYLIPVWFMGSVAAGIVTDGIVFGGGADESREGCVLCQKLYFSAAAFPVLALWLLSFVAMVSYPFRLSDGNAARYLKFFPNNVFLLSQAAAGEAAAGHFDAAFAYMERVPAEGRDFWPEYYRETARLSFLSRRAADDKTLSHLLVSEHNEHSVMIYQALNYIETSATPLKARDMLSCALQYCMQRTSMIRDIKTKEEADKLLLLRRDRAGKCINEVFNSFSSSGFTEKRRKALSARLKKYFPDLLTGDALFGVYTQAQKPSCDLDPLGKECLLSDSNIYPKVCAGVLRAGNMKLRQ